jgi:hypothetical protein
MRIGYDNSPRRGIGDAADDIGKYLYAYFGNYFKDWWSSSSMCMEVAMSGGGFERGRGRPRRPINHLSVDDHQVAPWPGDELATRLHR